MNSSHQVPYMHKSVPEWLLKNPKFMEQVKKEKEQNDKKKVKECQEQTNQQESSSSTSTVANIVELD